MFERVSRFRLIHIADGMNLKKETLQTFQLYILMKFNAEQLEKITTNILCILIAILVSLFKYLYYSAHFQYFGS